MFAQSFIDDVRAAADIVVVVQETVPLRQSGATYKGLCPFHGEKTPSFHVNRDRGFFHCFGCGVGGDVFKFVELRDRIGFVESVRTLAEKFGLRVPESDDDRRSAGEDAEREALLKMHEIAAGWFREQLDGPYGERARRLLAGRGIEPRTADALRAGFAPTSRDGLTKRLQQQGFALPLILKSGLAVERAGTGIVDRFRNRLVIPICRESGAVIGFGGRAMDAEQVPKYLNSPETPIYVKGRTLYGLHLSKHAVRKEGRAILVEGYFDFAQSWQAGVEAVVATSGTAMTPAQAHLLRRFSSSAVLSFDADGAGQTAAARSSELLVAEGFDVAVAVLPPGEDPDTFVRRHGGPAYAARIADARPYLDFLLERTAARHDLATPAGRRAFVNQMLGVAANIPDAAGRDQFADRLAHQARISEDVVRADIRRAAVGRRTAMTPRELQPAGPLKPAERHLLAALTSAPEESVRALAALEEADFEGLTSAGVLRVARSLGTEPGETLLSVLFERLTDQDARLLTAVATVSPAQQSASECVRALRQLRFERERTDLQRQIDRLQELSRSGPELESLLERKYRLVKHIEALKA